MPTVRTNNIETYYERRGAGPPVVFVHAALLDHSMWDEQVAALSDDYTTVTYDVRGHGKTDGSDDAVYTMDRYAADLHDLFEALDLEQPVVCGLSLGGMIAQTYAAAHPGRIRGLVLADTFSPPIRTRGEWFLRRVVLNALIPPVRLLGIERVEKANVWLTDRFFGGAGGDYESVERLRESGPKMDTKEVTKVIRSITRFHETTVELGAITVPTLVLYGENELPYVKQHAAAFGATFPVAELDEIPDAGHASNLDNPAYFSAALRTFFTRTLNDADSIGA
ncbi:alpha/beta fold hydrolase [Halogeometricum borinquense]|uniref:Alpha/beta fold hydrolase n=1 Tax=Halogeometricum borinquense TaxID=60847 RepID=A0A482T749_9EURY|nr:alpha/beta fold hydrolase [Halogeometricum borinquense]RYJ13550.1 alpha/beta fold hydrolase [Halogeometricum borinquense]